MSGLRRGLVGLALTLSVAAVIFAGGPRNEFGGDVPTPREAPPLVLDQLDAWLKKQESVYNDIKPGAEKGIVWNSASKQRTPWAVVNVHGFSASRQETAPVSELIAKALGANRYEARLSGHGRGSLPMGEPSVQDWLADGVEAMQIGQALGERVLFIGTSTGATLGTWLAARADDNANSAFVFISPNYAPRDPKAGIVNWPWGKQLTTAIIGETSSWTTDNPLVSKIWTTSYPTKAIFPMMALVKHVGEMDLHGVRSPVLMLYSEGDKVINTEEVRKAFARIGSPKKSIEAIGYSTDGNQHVLASEVVAPEAVKPLSDTVIKWVQLLPH